MNEQIYLGIDLGAESGRVMAGAWNGRQLRAEELHRFSNGPVNVGGTLRWDVLRLWSEIQNGLAIAARHYGDKVVSVGVDTWGVDFVLLTKTGELAGQPYHYRDGRVAGVYEYAFKRAPRAEIFARTGLQFMEINTLYQLLAFQRANPELLAAADCLLMMPDFFHWCLCGSRVAEFTDATTSQCLNPVTRDWAFDLLKKFDLPERIFPKIVPPGTELGRLRQSVCERTGLAAIKVIAPPTHDTASRRRGDSHGRHRQNKLGVCQFRDLVAHGCRDAECRVVRSRPSAQLHQRRRHRRHVPPAQEHHRLVAGAAMQEGLRGARGNLDYAELARLAEESPATGAIIDPDDPRLANPPDMPAAIQSLCRENNQTAPETEGALVRCALESLAARYAQVLGGLEKVTGTGIDVIHVVGGGSRNQLLNQLTANRCRRRVVAGPAETTALGNLLSQVRAAPGN